MLIYIDAIIKLLNNEFMFHPVNNHVVPLGITCNIMNIQTYDHARAALSAPKARTREKGKDFVHELSAKSAYARFYSHAHCARAAFSARVAGL